MTIITERRTWTLALVVVAFAAGLWAAHRWHRASSAVAGPEFQLASLSTSTPAQDFTLYDGEGRSRSLRDFRGRVVLMFFGFTRCPDVCPTELFKLSQVKQSLADDGARVQVIFITLDPERDSPALMQTYTSAFDPDFVGLTGSREQIDKVAAQYYVAHAKAGPPDSYVIDHSTSTYVIDPAGRLRLLGRMDTSVEAFVHDIRLLLRDQPGGAG
nr:SCO family protein [uncultured Steroidobacter sp.]